MRGREQKGPRTMIEKINEIARSAYISAQRANCLRQRSDLDIYAPVHAEVIDRAAAVAAQYAGGVRVVDHHDGAVFFGQVAESGQRANVAVHGEHAVTDQQLLARLSFDA